jgi:predicted ArsR family transcriptional regulator
VSAMRERILLNLPFNAGVTAAGIAAVLRLPVADVRHELIAMQRAGLVQRWRPNAAEAWRWCDCCAQPTARIRHPAL